ncbi:hypothetical protein [Roseibium aggregatum]|uniref:Uncharacterized protein n=1 Tax=Roseibium aggregatum TaxID=187304 RepID=A0A926NYH2_9HYPH|nr:hypothetical protein [Roseibium aggregatum]MBD1545930.1 hypothetical protein [Roseibium aggregatum]
MARPKIGDVLEIETDNGNYYLQYTHKHPDYHGLVRVYDTPYPSCPDNICGILDGPKAFYCFTVISFGLKRKVARTVGNCPIPDGNKNIPMFRGRSVIAPVLKKPADGHFGDAEKGWSRIGRLTPEARQLPILGVWPFEWIVDRVQAGWRPKDDPR